MALQERTVPELSEDQEPGLSAAVTRRSSCLRSIRRAMACPREVVSPCVLAQPGPPGELRVGDAPRPRLRVARQLGHEPDPADDAALEKGDAIGTRLALREGPPPDDGCGLHHTASTVSDCKSSAPLAVASDAGTGRAPSLEALAPTVCHGLASTLATFGLLR